jgi:hypothetical protein
MTVSVSLFGGLEAKREMKARLPRAQLMEKWRLSKAELAALQKETFEISSGCNLLRHGIERRACVTCLLLIPSSLLILPEAEIIVTWRFSLTQPR